MALVSYDYDSTSENEEEEIPISSAVILPNKNVELEPQAKDILIKDITPDISNKAVEENKYSNQNSLFSALPESKTVDKNIIEEQIEDFIPKPTAIKKEKQKVKIRIPSLSQYQDLDDEPDTKKLKSSAKGSGLISILPPVKGYVKSVTSFVPKVIADKAKATVSNSSTNPLLPDSVRKKAEAKKGAIGKKAIQKVKVVLSDAESDDDLDVPETFDDEMWEKVCGRPKNKPVIQEPQYEDQQDILNIAPEPEKPYEGLDNRAFKELVGKSKRPLGNIKLIDINEEEIMADKDLWMAKSMTDPEMAPRAVIDDPVDPTRRKKHHITYLAQQAKANEQDLKNSWAISKNNRMASRSKYGF